MDSYCVLMMLDGFISDFKKTDTCRKCKCMAIKMLYRVVIELLAQNALTEPPASILLEKFPQSIVKPLKKLQPSNPKMGINFAKCIYRLA